MADVHKRGSVKVIKQDKFIKYVRNSQKKTAKREKKGSRGNNCIFDSQFGSKRESVASVLYQRNGQV